MNVIVGALIIKELFDYSDDEIVWYGSMNFLSKEDAEDNLMRIENRDIAAELMEMTFGNNNDLAETR